MANSYSHLWNNLPRDERERLHPFIIESHILHLRQTRAKVIEGHQVTLRLIDTQISNLEKTLTATSAVSS